MASDTRSQSRSSAPSSFVQVCDRCRWKKIKCDGSRPCVACKNANLPCEARARLSKQATPRSYVQYLEARVRQLEGQRESEWSPQAASSRHSPYGQSHLRSTTSHTSDESHPKKQGLPDWSVLRELGTHVIDEDGFARYMGPSSGVGFAAKVLQEIFDNDQPEDPEYYSLFSLDDFAVARKLEKADAILWHIEPTRLPDRSAAGEVLKTFFTFTERVFPVLHRPTFMDVVDDLYSKEHITPDDLESLSQFYFALSIGHNFHNCNADTTQTERVDHQIEALQTGCKCYFNALHTRRDGLARLQTLTLHAYALVLLRQRSEAIRLSSMANVKALECGLHHDGYEFHGNPLQTEMRRRVFWCVFMLNLFNSSITGLPRVLHEADITIAEPSDIDDDQLTTTKVYNGIPGRTKIHRFVSMCRLCRILSRALDVLFTQNRRKHASTRIEQMERLCCEHLLDQLDFTPDEEPEDIPDTDSQNPEDISIVASYASEQILYHYIRWLIHRPGLALELTDPQFSSCLSIATEAASKMLQTAAIYGRAIPSSKANPGGHPCTIFIAALTPLYRTILLRKQSSFVSMPNIIEETDLQACQNALRFLTIVSKDHADVTRRRVLQSLIARVYGDDHEELRHVEPIKSNDIATDATTGARATPDQSLFMSRDHIEQQMAHFTAHEDLRSFVHEAFSPADPWSMDPVFGQSGAY